MPILADPLLVLLFSLYTRPCFFDLFILIYEIRKHLTADVSDGGAPRSDDDRYDEGGWKSGDILCNALLHETPPLPIARKTDVTGDGGESA